MIKQHELFITPLWESSLNIDNKKIEEEIYSIKSKDDGVKLTNQGGWQSTQSNEESIFSKLFESIRLLLLDLPIKNKELDNIVYWLNVNSYRDYNKLHHHCGSDLSGVYYVKVPKDSNSTIAFSDPRKIIVGNSFFTDEYHNYNSVMPYNPLEGSLLIFPSFLEHYVDPNQSQEDRITIAFNLFFKDK